MAVTRMPTPLVVAYSGGDLFDLALKEESIHGHHSKCYFGSKTKVAAAASSDPNWAAPRAKFMPEVNEIHFTYGNQRFVQQMTRAEVRWIDRFDTDQDVRSRTIVLDPNGPNTRLLHVKGGSRSYPTTRKPPTVNPGSRPRR